MGSTLKSLLITKSEQEPYCESEQRAFVSRGSSFCKPLQLFEGLPIEQGNLESEFLRTTYFSSGAVANEAGITIQHTPPGLYAVIRHRGSYAQIKETIESIFKWLPESDYEIVEGPVVDLYLNNPDTTPEEELLTDICVPIAKKGNKEAVENFGAFSLA